MERKQVVNRIISVALLLLCTVTIVPKEWVHHCEHNTTVHHTDHTQDQFSSVVDECSVCDFTFSSFVYSVEVISSEKASVSRVISPFELTYSDFFSPVFFSLRAPPVA